VKNGKPTTGQCAATPVARFSIVSCRFALAVIWCLEPDAAHPVNPKGLCGRSPQFPREWAGWGMDGIVGRRTLPITGS
jgi:hypothetical protein